MPARTSRHLVALIALIAALGLALSSCASSGPSGADSNAEASAGGDGPWAFTDDLGKTIALDHQPTKVVALTDVAYSLIAYGLKPVAAFGRTTIADDKRFEGQDTSGIVDLGATYGEINLEKLAAMAPDVIVTQGYPTATGGSIDTKEPLYGFTDLAQQEKVAAIAPIITIAMAGNGADVIKKTTDLAIALGAAADSGPIADGKKAYDEATAKLTAAAANGVVAQTMYAEAANVYIAKETDDPTLTLYGTLGLEFVKPKTKNFYWDIISWEDYDTIGGDLVLFSQEGFGKDELMKQPTFAATPAAKADQVQPWEFTGMDYVTQAAYISRLADWVAAAKKVS